MQRLEVSGAVRPLQWSLGVKGLIIFRHLFIVNNIVFLAFSLKDDAGLKDDAVYNSHCAADLNGHHKQCSRPSKFSLHASWPAI